MARVGRVEAGQDGSFRMTVDRKYENVPALRRTAKTLAPIWFFLLASKILFVAMPLRTAVDSADMTTVQAYGACSLLMVAAWFLAALGSRKEWFQAVVMFNVVGLITLAVHALRIVNVHLHGTKQDIRECHAVVDFAAKYIQILSQNKEEFHQGAEYAGIAIDGGLLLVGIPLVSAMHIYITEIKEARKAQSQVRARKAL